MATVAVSLCLPASSPSPSLRSCGRSTRSQLLLQLSAYNEQTSTVLCLYLCCSSPACLVSLQFRSSGISGSAGNSTRWWNILKEKAETPPRDRASPVVWRPLAHMSGLGRGKGPDVEEEEQQQLLHDFLSCDQADGVTYYYSRFT